MGDSLGTVEYPGGVPPTWRVVVRRAVREDGSVLVYLCFSPSPDVPEGALG